MPVKVIPPRTVGKAVDVLLTVKLLTTLNVGLAALLNVAPELLVKEPAPY